MKIKPIFAWYDLWIGAYIDRARRYVYVLPLPMVGFRIDLAKIQCQFCGSVNVGDDHHGLTCLDCLMPVRVCCGYSMTLLDAQEVQAGAPWDCVEELAGWYRCEICGNQEEKVSPWDTL
jgi:hypothetical protein